jgi:hypothetical protein
MSYHHPQGLPIGASPEERRKAFPIVMGTVALVAGGWWYVAKKMKESNQKEMRSHIKRSRKLYGEDPHIEASIRKMYA